MMFLGSGVALVTPFKNNGEIDYETLKKLITFHIGHKTDAIIICGTTGEASTLSIDEHLKCIEKCVEYADKKILIIAGTGSNNTQTAINNSMEAEKIGADGLLLVTPYYNKTTQDGLIKHYGLIADKVNIPILLYNVPSRTGLNINPSTFGKLFKSYENIVGIKEASGNIDQVAEIMDITNRQALIYSGNDSQIVPIMSLGGVGVISVVANIMPDIIHDMVFDYIKGNRFDELDKQIKMLKLTKSLFCETNPIPIKKAMELMGMIDGYIRPPLFEMSEENTKVLTRELINHNLVKRY